MEFYKNKRLHEDLQIAMIKIKEGLAAMRRESAIFIDNTTQHSTTQADCDIFYRRILTFIKHVLSDGLSDGICFSFYGEMPMMHHAGYIC